MICLGFLSGISSSITSTVCRNCVPISLYTCENVTIADTDTPHPAIIAVCHFEALHEMQDGDKINTLNTTGFSSVFSSSMQSQTVWL